MPLSLDDRLRSFRSNRRETSAAPSMLHNLLGGEEKAGAGGSFYLIKRFYQESLYLPPLQPKRLLRNLRLLHGVGPRTEEKMRACGWDTLDQLQEHERWSGQAREILRDIAGREIKKLQRRGVYDLDTLSFFAPEDIVFVDIETTGLYSVLPLFLVGVLYADKGGLCLEQFLARRFDEEGPLLAAAAEVLKRFKLIVSYNGRAFDVPYLAGRFLAHRLSCRLDHVHIDLLKHVRRKFHGHLQDCRLTTVEAAVLNEVRADDVPGYLIPELYHQFVKTQDQEIIKGIIGHNAQDLLALARLIKLVE